MTRDGIIAFMNQRLTGFPENRTNGRAEFLPVANLAVERAVLVLYARQTADEQNSDTTSHENGMGFNGTDAFILSQFARQIETSEWPRGKRLSPKQMGIARRKVRKYSRQLLEVAAEKMAA